MVTIRRKLGEGYFVQREDRRRLTCYEGSMRDIVTGAPPVFCSFFCKTTLKPKFNREISRIRQLGCFVS
jgi:hypothetical protein